MADKWTLAGVWNKALERKEERIYEPRDRIWASELYNSDIDIYLKLKGEQPTNLPNSRSMRKFDAGNMFEWFVKIILARIGIYKATQTRVMFELPGYLKVSGKIDFVAGGMPDYDTKIEEAVGGMDLPDLYQRQIENMIEFFKKEYPSGLQEKILEIKSVATFGFDRVEKANKPLGGHDLQAFHYAFNTGKEVALVYLCREDMRMMEFTIRPDDQELKEKYFKRILDITDHYNRGIEPDKEPFIVYDETVGKFSKNFKVEYSSYLTKLYGFKEPAEYDAKFGKMISSWNRVLTRVAKGAKMTPKNEDILKQIEAFGYNLEIIKKNIAELTAKGISSDEEGEEE